MKILYPADHDSIYEILGMFNHHTASATIHSNFERDCSQRYLVSEYGSQVFSDIMVLSFTDKLHLSYQSQSLIYR
jgi:hypothetical protein